MRGEGELVLALESRDSVGSSREAEEVLSLSLLLDMSVRPETSRDGHRATLSGWCILGVVGVCSGPPWQRVI